MVEQQAQIMSLLRESIAITQEIVVLLETKEKGFDSKVMELYGRRGSILENLSIAYKKLLIAKQKDNVFSGAYKQEERQLLDLDTQARGLLEQSVQDVQEKLRAIYRGKHLNAYLSE
jgi:hypothetical protein